MKKSALFLSLFTLTLTACGYSFDDTSSSSINSSSSESSSSSIEGNDHFYRRHEVSIIDAEKHTSEVDALFTYMASSNKSAEDINKWGTKFFIEFVQDACAGCDDVCGGFKLLESNWGKGEFNKEGSSETFKFYTIYVDVILGTDDIDENLFVEYIFPRYDVMFEDIKATMQDSIYARNSGSSYLHDLDTLDDMLNFATPTIFLYDPSYTQNVSVLGVSEVLFNVKGKGNKNGNLPIARTLFDCWYHQDIFGTLAN